jgi:ribonuclease HII
MIHPKIRITKNFFEKEAWAEGLYTCGLDEVGRGCLAGPVVVGAVILPHNTTYHLLKDSKILTEEERKTAFKWINAHCQWTVSIVGNHMIDTINIYQATLFGMKKAYLNLTQTLSFPIEQLKYVLIDAMPLEMDKAFGHEKLEFHHFNYGERFSTSIAAASIVAKVTRDNLMEKISPYFPAFSFEQHKGYATKQHINALLTHGPTIIHRTSFIKSIKKESDTEETLQKNLFGEYHE